MHSVSTTSITSRHVVALAQGLRVSCADAAAGRCFALSLELAAEARGRHGIELDLVKWRVRGDPNYADHWAVLLDDGNVIDLTRVQVDGSTRLVCPLADYPANYERRRVYPARLLLDAYAELRAGDGALLAPRFMWACGTRLLRFDLVAALRAWRPAEIAAALSEAVAFLTCFGAACLLHWLESRESMLRMRLRPTRVARLEASPPPRPLEVEAADIEPAAPRSNATIGRFG